MATTYTKSGSFGWAGGGKSGAVVDLWAATRFGVYPPVQDQSPPGGLPDAGPVTTGITYGSPGAYLITGIPVVQDYCIRIQYGGHTYWGECSAASLGGQPGTGGGLKIVTTIFYGSAYTLALTDANTAQQALSVFPATINVPYYPSVPFPIGTVISVTQNGPGKIQIAAAAGVTIESAIGGGFVSGVTGTRAENSTIGLLNTANNLWVIAGDAG